MPAANVPPTSDQLSPGPPRSAPGPRAAETEPIPADVPLALLDDESERSAKILVVDDEPSVVDVFQEFLSAQGYELAVATTGEEALRRSPSSGPTSSSPTSTCPGSPDSR